jgi:hypothetical protein
MWSNEPVPGGPAMSSAFPAIFLPLIRSTTVAHASRAASCPTSPAAIGITVPSSRTPSPLICVWVAMRCAASAEATSSIFIDMTEGRREAEAEDQYRSRKEVQVRRAIVGC